LNEINKKVRALDFRKGKGWEGDFTQGRKEKGQILEGEPRC